MTTRRQRYFPIAQGTAYRYRVQKLAGRTDTGRVWETVKTARASVAERILLLRRTDKELVRLVQR